MKKGQNTRFTILQKAFEISYQKGYQATSVDDIIHFTTVTKGSFFYHFKSKDEMGLAMINEVMFPGMRQALIKPLEKKDTSKALLFKMMKSILLEDPNFDPRYGCPAVNIIEEMAPINQHFNKAIGKLIDELLSKIESVIVLGIKNGEIDKNIKPKQAAHFIISGYMGIRTLGKLYGTKCYDIYLKELKNYINSL
ncbi:TetR/AcrR family transcriptional regulator [Aquimarina gracilis]|uniref:TetR/AcrR family transcriptional regulator n=1 Tax=Aquimarina gracilis TaxID=874422 RepID=A0ABU5ZYW9_9FLAO|nr:TetR/AcrR family transcriptional regulator [Aquimarina gracilis]MEB3347097.1 TetR/AcrR family transcriptional regulator [Aquimarina gracilis]